MASRRKIHTDLSQRTKQSRGRAKVDRAPGTRENSASGSVTVRVPIALKRRGGRKLVLTPNGGPAWSPPTQCFDNTVVRALARAHRWKRMIESGKYGCLTELANAEKINHSYLGRVLRLTLLAPDIAEAVLEGRQPRSIQLARFLGPIPIEWERQRREFKKD
jgi:hypothetical protein